MWRRASLLAIVLLAAGTAAAQDRPPIRTSISREVARLVAAEQPGSAVSALVGQGAASAGSTWSRVRDRERGEKIIVKARDEEPVIRYVLSVDDVTLKVLNLTDLAIPAIARAVLLDAAEDHAGYFEMTERGQTFKLRKDVRLTPDGVFIGDSKVVDLGRIVENIPRDDVVEVSEFNKHIAPHVRRGLVIGAVAGGAFMLVAGYPYGEQDPAAAYALFGAMFGTGCGATWGVIIGAIAPRGPDVIYRRGS